jgi:hypothetical protein
MGLRHWPVNPLGLSTLRWRDRGNTNFGNSSKFIKKKKKPQGAQTQTQKKRGSASGAITGLRRCQNLLRTASISDFAWVIGAMHTGNIFQL